MDLYDEAHQHGEQSPTPAETLKALPPEAQLAFKNDEAVEAIASI